jgi:hypothetical protein
VRIVPALNWKKSTFSHSFETVEYREIEILLWHGSFHYFHTLFPFSFIRLTGFANQFSVKDKIFVRKLAASLT